MRTERLSYAFAALLLLALSCRELESDVEIDPMPNPVRAVAPRGASLEELSASSDFPGVIAKAATLARRRSLTPRELMLLGEAESSEGRFADARRDLAASFAAQKERIDRGRAAWDLSENESMTNNFAAAAHWAGEATENGVRIQSWQRRYLEALSTVDVYRIPKPVTVTLPITHHDPDVPRIGIVVNRSERAHAVIDSGATVSIISDTVAAAAAVRVLGDFSGEMLGLLNEPIEVRYGLIDHLEIGGLVIENVPVAIMPASQMRFLSHRRPFTVDLLAGTDLLKEFRFEFDFRSSSMKLTPLPPGSRTPARDANLFLIDQRPMVRVMINEKQWFPFLLDTGSEMTFLNEARLASTEVHRTGTPYSTLLQGLGGASRVGLKLPGIRLGLDGWSGSFGAVPLFNSIDSWTVGIVGENFLQNFRVTIDFGAMRVDLRRN